MKHPKLLLAGLLSILIAESILTGLIPHARGMLFDALEIKADNIYFFIGIYFMTYLGLEFFQSIKEFTITVVALKYREWRTHKLFDKSDKTVPNYAQRVQEDVLHSYVKRFTAWCEYLISAIIVVQLLIINIDQPKLLLAALLFAGLSVTIAVLFNPRLQKAEKDVSEKEADFRINLIPQFLDTANLYMRKLVWVKTEYNLFTKLQLAVMNVVPYIFLAPALIAGELTLGGLMKHQATFSLIVLNASILIHLYPTLIRGQASEARVKDLEEN